MSCLSLLIGDANVPEVTLAHPWVYILTRRLHGTWAVHIRGGLKEINQCNRSAKRVRQLMLNSLIQQYFDCYSVVWEVWVQNELYSFTNCKTTQLARIITFSSYNSTSSPLVQELGWDLLSIRRLKLFAIEMFKVCNNMAPEYLYAKNF